MKIRKCVMLEVCLMALCGCGGVREDVQSEPVAGESAELPDEVTDVVTEVATEETPEEAAEEPLEETGFNFETRTVMLNSGYEMPIMGLGTYALDHDTCVNSVKMLLENGGRLIDTAYMYHNEEAVGEGVRQAMEEYGIPREEIFVITKIYPSQFGDPEAAIELALEKLDIGYIDMMLLHHPGEGDVEAYKAMERYVEAGTIRSIGLSNWYIEELTAFLPQVTIMPDHIKENLDLFGFELTDAEMEQITSLDRGEKHDWY